MVSKFIRAVGLQFSGIVGAGIFTLPYFLSQTNFLGAVMGMLVITLIMAVVNIFYVQIICNTQGDHQLPGYTQQYLGKKFKLLATIILVMAEVGAILAYIKLGAGFIEILWSINTFCSVMIFLSFIPLTRKP